MPISSWPKTERPRERLLERGAEVLSDAELLAVLLRNGIKGKDAVTLARELLAKFGGLRGFLAVDLQHLKKRKRPGPGENRSTLCRQGNGKPLPPTGNHRKECDS